MIETEGDDRLGTSGPDCNMPPAGASSPRALALPALAGLAGSCAAALAAFAARWLLARALPLPDFGLVTLGIALVSAAGGGAALRLASAPPHRVAGHLP